MRDLIEIAALSIQRDLPSGWWRILVLRISVTWRKSTVTSAIETDVTYSEKQLVSVVPGQRGTTELDLSDDPHL